LQRFDVHNYKLKMAFGGQVIQFVNCRILYKGVIIKEDLWVRDGKILNPERIFFTEKKSANLKIDCHDMIISPGFIDVQINGVFYFFYIWACVVFKFKIRPRYEKFIKMLCSKQIKKQNKI